MCMHCSLTVLALILLYGGCCFTVRLPSKVMCSCTHRVRLPASCNNVPQNIKMFPDSIIHSCLMVFSCVVQWRIDEVGFGASSSGVY